MDDLRVLAFLGLFESLLLAHVCPGLLGVKLPLRRIIGVGIIHAVLVYLVRGAYRMLDLPLGTHTLLCLALLVVLLRFIGRVGWGAAVAGCLLGFQLVLLGEIAAFPVVGRLGIVDRHLVQNPWLHVAVGWVSLIPLGIMSVLIGRFNVHLRLVRDRGQRRRAPQP